MKYICTNLVKIACNYKNKYPYMTTRDIGNCMDGLCSATIRKWLKIGNKLNWCKYNPKEESKNILSKNHEKRKYGKSVSVYKDDVFIKNFISIKQLIRKSEKIFNVKFNKTMVIKSYKENLTYKGYTFKIK